MTYGKGLSVRVQASWLVAQRDAGTFPGSLGCTLLLQIHRSPLEKNPLGLGEATGRVFYGKITLVWKEDSVKLLMRLAPKMFLS